MLLVMGDFNAKVGRREPSAMSSAVGLYGLGETNEAGKQLEDFCLEHELALANIIFKHELMNFVLVYHIQTTSKAAVHMDLS